MSKYVPICPKCGGDMFLKQFVKSYTDEYGRPAGEEVSRFYGCKNYPRCNGSMSIYDANRERNAKAREAVRQYHAKNATNKSRIIASKKEKINYYEYIRSARWKAKATAAKKRAGYRCQVCNVSAWNSKLDAHHRTYARLGYEADEDITVLCRRCHKIYHDEGKLYNA